MSNAASEDGSVALPPSALLKLRRADQHISDLVGLVDAFLDERPFKLIRRFDPDTGDLTISIKQEKPTPDIIPLTLGDALHNLRCVLDHTYFAIISRHTHRRDNIQFPIYRPEIKESVLGRRLIKLTTKEVGSAVEACEPEPGGRYGIYELDAIDVEDKHRVLLITARGVDIPAQLFNFIAPEAGLIITGPGIVRFAGGDGGEDNYIFSVPLPPSHPTAQSGAIETDIPVRVKFALTFGDGPFAGTDIIPKVAQLRTLIEEAASSIWRAANP
ncbi:hypothetical protein ACFSTI_24950 [Rhizorhabdus histidinilytica]|nr:hypothetical protein [Rhizorhabdus histidinilytica]